MPKLIAGNWKMNGLRADGLALARGLAERMKSAPLSCDLLICPPATLLISIAALLTGSKIGLGGQDCAGAAAGAFTGDLSPAMLKDAGCSHVILGHSERRAIHRESDAEIALKLIAARASGLIPILCVGESEQQRDAGQAVQIVSSQLRAALPADLRADQFVVAYEPVWAIGSGRTPTAHEISDIHAAIRKALPKPAQAARILYGGSVKPANARAILALPGVDGALVGGASLALDDFWAIGQAAG
jgi:triosephosphate isomerase